jgi:spore coat protein H
MNKLFYLIFPFLFILFSCENDKENELKQVVKEFKIVLDQADLDSIYKNPKPNTYIPITIISNGDTVRSAKMRIRGDSSREYAKKSLKIVFNKEELLKGEERKINLNSEWTDKSYIRQYLSAHIMAKAGLNTFTANFVKLYINDKFFGLYLQVENMDKSFLKARNLDKNGNLYKATKDGACLSTYDDVNKLWEKKTNKHTDWQDLHELIAVLDTISPNRVQDYLQQNFEYDKLITIIAVNMLIQNSSTYYHNYYMYHDIYGSNKWQMIPWDLDKTMSYYCWKPYTYDETSNKWLSDNVLIERVLMDEKGMNDIIKKVEELGVGFFNNNKLQPIIDNLERLLEEAVNQDHSDQITNIEEWKNQLKKESDFISQQVAYISNQLKTFPRGFLLHKINETQIAPPMLKWNSSKSPIGKNITYQVYYSKDYLFESEETKFFETVTDTFFQIPKTIGYGKYFWKIRATDGENVIDGFNTRNSFEYIRPTTISKDINKTTIWKRENSPYHIVNDITVTKGASLMIEKGCDIILKEDINLYVKGRLHIDGQKGKEVIFRPEKKQWGELHLYGSKNKNIINHTLFNEGVFRSSGTDVSLLNTTFNIKDKNLIYGGHRQAVIWVNRGKFTMKYCSLISNGTGEGMNINFAETEVMNSYFNNAPDAIEVMNVSKGIIYRNYVENSPDDAIDMNGCKDIVAQENYMLNNNDKAISVGTEEYGPSVNIVVKNNLIINQGTGVSVKDSSNALVKHNTLINVNRGIKAYLKNNKKQYTVGGRAISENNLFYSTNTNVVEFDENSDVQISYSCAEKRKLEGVGNLIGKPGFVNPERGNYHLLPSSICKNKGNDGGNIGRYPDSLDFLSMIKRDDYYILKNPNLFNVDLSGYYLRIEGEIILSLPRYMIKRDEEIIITNKAKGRKFNFRNRIIELKELKINNKKIELLDNKNNIIFCFE